MARSRRRDRRPLLELAAGAAALGYGAVVNRLLPDVVHLPANSAAATAFVAAARRSGATLDDLGLAPERVWPGVRTGLTCAVPVVAGVACAAAIPQTRRFFSDRRVVDVSDRRALYEVAIRIPVGTALAEELIFRGALLALLRRRGSTARAMALSSLAFGLWHMFSPPQAPPRNTTDRTQPGSRPARSVLAAAGVVLVTAAAGYGFGRLRLRSGSVVAPALVHAALNASAFAATRIVSH
jgi:membrane protease YdiL (CAAX protease family)